MGNSMLLTILTGVSVFVIGQFVLKLVLDPIVSLKKIFGEISAFFLKEQAKITNAHGNDELCNEISRLSSSILANSTAIPFYGFFSFILRMPSNGCIIKSCHSMNLISHNLNPKAQEKVSVNGSLTILENMKTISENLKIKIDYQEL